MMNEGKDDTTGGILGIALATALVWSSLAIARRLLPAPARVASTERPGRAAPPSALRRAWTIAVRTWEQTGRDNVSVLAAGVAFYALLSIFPALTALVSVYGLFADPANVQQQLEQLRGVLPEDATSLLSTWLGQLVQRSPSSFGLGLVISLAISLWGARYATGTLMTALNIAYDEPESRNLLRFNAVALALTALLIVFAIASIALIAVLPAVIGLLPLPPAWQSVATLVRWPILALLVIVAVAALYRFAPNRAEPRWQWASAGAVVATLLWIVASYGFSIYVAGFASYDKTYGSLGAVVVLLMWFWLGAYAVLAGAELNAEIEKDRGR